MSIEAFTCEEIKIRNNNEKTAKLSEEVGNYLIKNWGIVSLSLTVDGNTYTLKNADRIEENSDIYNVCKNLAVANVISIFQRSVNGASVVYRTESSFLKYLSDDDDLKQNVTYRSTDYYDCDDYVDMCLYNENGLQKPEYNNTADSIADIEKWFCYTPTIHIFAEEYEGKAELYEKATSLLRQMGDVLSFTEDEFEDHFEDNWADCGELSWFNSIIFSTEGVKGLKDIGSQLMSLCSNYDDIDFAFEISAVPDGENDYDFASVRICCEDGEVVDKYCRF